MIPQTVRENVLPGIDRAISPTGLYTMYRLSYEEIVAEKLECSIDEVVHNLKDIGFQYHGISAAKLHPTVEKIDSGSYRYIPDEHPDVEARVTREWEPEECQYHIHIFDMREFVHMFCHYELRHDLFSPSINLERTKTHYRPVHDEDYIKGVTPGPIEEVFS